MGKIKTIESLIKKESCDVMQAKKLMLSNGTWGEDDSDISIYDNVILLEKKGYKGLDLYICWDDNQNDKFLFLVQL